MKPKKEKTFADRLWEFRERNGLTQEAAAKLLNVKKKTLESWEHGRYAPRPPLDGLLRQQMQNYKPPVDESP